MIYSPLKSVCIVFKPVRFSLKCPLVYLGNSVQCIRVPGEDKMSRCVA